MISDQPTARSRQPSGADAGRQRQLLGRRHRVRRRRWSGIIVVPRAQIARHQRPACASTTRAIEATSRSSRAEIGDYDVIKAQRDELIRQRDAIKRLQANRAGPMYLMRELSDILTPGQGPDVQQGAVRGAAQARSQRRVQPELGPRRAWLVSYTEQRPRGQDQGRAKSDEDVAEFLKRLKLSAFFCDVYWQQTQPQVDTKLNVIVRDLRRDLPGELLMQQLLRQVRGSSLTAKLGVLVGLMLRWCCGGYWYFFYCDMHRRAGAARAGESRRSRREKKEYEKRKQEYLAFRNEVNALLEEQKELLRVLPKKDDIEQFIENVQAQIELTGLSKVASVREAAHAGRDVREDPDQDVADRQLPPDQPLLQAIGELKRIVNIEDLSLDPVTRRGRRSTSRTRSRPTSRPRRSCSPTRAAGARRAAPSITSGGGQ